jgi:hypothetical protein
LEYKNKLKTLYTYLMFIGSFLSLFLAIRGFSLWYTRIQKIQDKILKNEEEISLKNKENEKHTGAH